MSKLGYCSGHAFRQGGRECGRRKMMPTSSLETSQNVSRTQEGGASVGSCSAGLRGETGATRCPSPLLGSSADTERERVAQSRHARERLASPDVISTDQRQKCLLSFCKRGQLLGCQACGVHLRRQYALIFRRTQYLLIFKGGIDPVFWWGVIFRSSQRIAMSAPWLRV